MAVTVIIEFEAKPGQGGALRTLMAEMGEKFGPIIRERGGLSFALYAATDNPDLIFEIADWETEAAREALMEEAAASGAFAPLMDLLARPPKVQYVSAVS